MRLQMNSIGLRLTLVVALAAALAGCGGDDAVDKPPVAPAIETFVVRGGADAEGRAWDGTVEAVREAVLSAQTSGRVASVDVDVNDRVAAGQVLLRLTVVEQQAGVDAARAQLRASEAAAIEAERQYQRFASLARDKYVSGAQLDQARAARDAANAVRDAARAQVSAAGQNADYTTVRAPYAGIVAARRVEPGETVGPGQPLLTVYAPDDLRIEVRVPQSAADAIRAKPQARVVFDEGRSVDARDVVVHPTADPASHSVPVRVALPQLDGEAPAPGATARVVFPIAGAGDSGVRIPANAVARRGELTAVYVLKDGRVLLRQVRLGARRGDTVEVLAGLAAGDVVARDPAEALRMLASTRAAGSDRHG